MLVQLCTVVVLLSGAAMAAADAIQLKEKTSVTGKILAEKEIRWLSIWAFGSFPESFREFSRDDPRGNDHRSRSITT